jgi:hypothetical protein
MATTLYFNQNDGLYIQSEKKNEMTIILYLFQIFYFLTTKNKYMFYFFFCETVYCV